MTWVLDLVRMLLSIFDRMVYGLIEVFYTAFVEISQVRVFTDDVLKTLADRVYTFLALIMLFKLAFSIITYIINPDNFSNSEQGMGKVIQNIVIMLILLVVTPHIFTQAYNLQRIVITNNIIPQIILGTGSNEDLMDSEVHKSMSFTVLNAFLKPNTGQIIELADDGGYKCNGFPMFSDDQTEKNAFKNCLNNLSEQQARVPEPCVVTPAGTNNTVDTVCYVPSGMGEAYVYAYEHNDYNALIDLITAKYKEDKDIYLFDYTYLISTIAGGFVAWILLIFCFDIAVRSVKFSFLQLIAPIPIISYVDPKSGKGGMFKKWMDACLSTYADLFIRLVAIYFAVFIVKVVSDQSQIYYVDSSMGTPNFFIKVFIIIGALMFAKEIPKMIADITGLNLSGKFELNPLKKLGQSPFAAAAIGGIGAMAGGAAANLYNGIKEGRTFGGTLRSTLGGATSGFFRGAHAGLTGKGNDNVLKAAGAGLKGTVDARNLRTRRQAAGDGGLSGFMRRTGVALENAAGVESGASKFDKEIAAYDSFAQVGDSLESYAEKEILKNKGAAYKNSVVATAAQNVSTKKNMIEALKAVSTTGMTDAQLEAHAAKLSSAESDYFLALRDAKQTYVDQMKTSDATVESSIKQMQRIIDDNAGLYSGFSSVNISTGKDISDSIKNISNESKRVKASDEYVKAHVGAKTGEK